MFNIFWDPKPTWIAWTFLGGAGTLAVISVFDALGHAPPPQNPIYHYQTLISGILALVAAVLTALMLYLQIELQWKIEERRRKRKERAARAALPAALSQFCDYTEACTRRSFDLLQHAETSDWTEIDIPALPFSSVNTIREFIEHANEDTGEYFENFVQKVQIYRTRLLGTTRAIADPDRNGVTQIGLDRNAIDRILESAHLYAMASNAFSFARGNDACPRKPVFGDINHAFFIFRIEISDYQKVLEEARRRYGASPMDSEG